MGGLVDKIIAAKKQYDETDRPWLSKLADGQLGKIAASCGCDPMADPAVAAAAPAATPPTAPATTPDPTPTASTAAPAAAATGLAPAAAPVAAAAPAPEAPLTAEQWIEKTPENLRGVFGGLLAQRRSSEAKLREQIVTQSGGRITKDYLASKELEELEMLAAGTHKPDFSGRGVQVSDPIAQASKSSAGPRMPGIKVGTGAAA